MSQTITDITSLADPHAAAMRHHEIVRLIRRAITDAVTTNTLPSFIAEEIAIDIIALDRPVPAPGPPGDHMTAIMRLCGDLADRGDEQTWLMTQAIIAHATALENRPVPPVAGEDHVGHIHALSDAGRDLVREIETACGIETRLHESFLAIEGEADALAAQLRASERRVAKEPLSREEAVESIGVAIHTALRKGVDTPEAHDLWMAIRDSKDAWPDAVEHALFVLERYAGVVLCRGLPANGEGDGDGDG